MDIIPFKKYRVSFKRNLPHSNKVLTITETAWFNDILNTWNYELKNSNNCLGLGVIDGNDSIINIKEI